MVPDFLAVPPSIMIVTAVGLLLVVTTAFLAWFFARGRRALRDKAPVTWTVGLAKTRAGLTQRLLDAWRGPAGQESWLAEVEEILLTSDVGVAATRALLDVLRTRARQVEDVRQLQEILKDAVREVLRGDGESAREPAKPRVIVVVGVNGVGKTTTIGKLAYRYRQQGAKVLLVAADTFRAAATEQLVAWARRVEADIVKHQHGADPAAVVFDGMKAALARGADVVIVDTAGRLHVKVNLMEELKKIVRTIERQIAGAPHEILLVIDATTGQNALSQARVFHEAIRLTGVVLAKLDGTAKGGVALAICKDLGLPIRYVGLGERPEDLAPFDRDEFVAALFAEASGGASA